MLIFLKILSREICNRNSSVGELYLLHNHPSTKTFSYSDIGVLLVNAKLKGITVITNAGNTEVLQKTEKYDYDTARRVLEKIRMEYQTKSLNEEQDAEIVKRFLKVSNKTGIVLL